MTYNEQQEARITAIQAERECTRGNAMKHFAKETAEAAKAARAAAKATAPKLTAQQRIIDTILKLEGKIKKAQTRLATLAHNAAIKGATAEQKAAVKAAKAQDRADAKAAKAAAKADTKALKAAERAGAKAAKAAAKAQAKADRQVKRDETKAAKSAAKADHVSSRKTLDTEKIVNMYKNGVTIGAISKELGASYMGIRLLLIREKVFGTVITAPKETETASK